MSLLDLTNLQIITLSPLPNQREHHLLRHKNHLAARMAAHESTKRGTSPDQPEPWFEVLSFSSNTSVMSCIDRARQLWQGQAQQQAVAAADGKGEDHRVQIDLLGQFRYVFKIASLEITRRGLVPDEYNNFPGEELWSVRYPLENKRLPEGYDQDMYIIPIYLQSGVSVTLISGEQEAAVFDHSNPHMVCWVRRCTPIEILIDAERMGQEGELATVLLQGGSHNSFPPE